MESLTTISIHKETKEQLDELKLCEDETYNSMLRRILPKWAIVLREKLNEGRAELSQQPNETTNNS